MGASPASHIFLPIFCAAHTPPEPAAAPSAAAAARVHRCSPFKPRCENISYRPQLMPTPADCGCSTRPSWARCGHSRGEGVRQSVAPLALEGNAAQPAVGVRTKHAEPAQDTPEPSARAQHRRPALAAAARRTTPLCRHPRTVRFSVAMQDLGTGPWHFPRVNTPQPSCTRAGRGVKCMSMRR